MKKEEKIAKEYLERLSSDVVYEPDGNIPPDFKLNQIIAVEVRRLNKNIFGRRSPRGLERDQRSVEDGLKEIIREFDTPIPTDNYRIKLRISRPIPKIRNLKSVAKKELLSFLENKPEMPFEIKLSPNISITINKANRKSQEVFHVGIVSDRDRGGWTGPLYTDNINHCIAEKTGRIQKYKSKYSEWWLVFVDFLAGGIGEPEKTFVIQHINKGSDWKKIIVIHHSSKKEILKVGSSDFIA